MLHKSFKPAKCKTALKMASSRMKLLKNKREAHVKQLKRELAQLLAAGQDQTARIRVEHVVREEKTLAAYDLLDIYCELIVARLQIIESQKVCPIDLKEAVASIIFASPRCADIPELMDARKHFAAKYGKDFVTSAVELRPDCGVSRLLVEKLSTKAPDGPTKIKILSAIADEHNIKWEPKSFGEKDSKPPEDLLSGPTTFEQASKMSSPHSTAQEPSNSFIKGPPNVQVSANQYKKPDPMPQPSFHPQNFLSEVNRANVAAPTDTFHPSPRHSGTGAGGREYRDLSPGDSRRSWNMEFKDATAAAQAAAESAERASMAARAAAELSSRGRMSRQHSAESRKSSASGGRMSRQHSIESRKSSASGSMDDFQNNTGSKFQDENLSRGPVNPVNSKYRSNGMHHEEVGNSEQDVLAGLTERFNNLKSSAKFTSNLGSTKSTSDSMDDNRPCDTIPMSGKQSQRSSELENRGFRDEETVSARGDSSESEVEPESGLHDGMKSETPDHFEEAYFKKQSSSMSLHPYSETFSEDHHVVSYFHNPELGKTGTGDHFVVDDANHQRNSMEANLYNNSDVVFDNYGSDHDDFKFDADNKSYGRESSSYFPAKGRRPSHPFADTNAWSYHTNISEGSKSSHSLNKPAKKPSSDSIFAPEQPSTGLFSEDLRDDAVSSRQDDLKSVTYDDSDAASSDSGEEVDNSKNARTASAASSSCNESLNSRKVQSTHVESDNDGAEVGAETEWEPGYRGLRTRKPSARLEKSQSNSNGSIKCSGHSSVNYQANEPLENEEAKSTGLSSLGGSKGLNFGALTGGLRHKGSKYPPYCRNPSSDSLSSKQSSDDTHIQDEQSSSNRKVKVSLEAQSQKSYNQTVHPRHKETGSRTTIMSSDSSDDDLDARSSQRNASSGRDSYDERAYTDTNDKSSPKMYYNSDNSGSKEDIPKQTSLGTSRFGSAFSRRTKDSTKDPVRKTSPEETASSESTENPDHVMERKSFSRRSSDTETRKGGAPSQPIPQLSRFSQKETSSHNSYGTVTQPSDLYQSRRSDIWQGYEPRRSAERAATKSKRSSQDERLKSAPPPEQPSKPPSKTVTLDSAESSKIFSSSADPPSKENSITRASHVHPKLPDYDTFAAHLLSLKQNRQ